MGFGGGFVGVRGLERCEVHWGINGDVCGRVRKSLVGKEEEGGKEKGRSRRGTCI